MKKVSLFLALVGSPAAVWSADLAQNQSYYGPVDAVAPGFYGYIGVELPVGSTCRGKRQLLLLTSNPRVSEIMALLLTAQTTHANVKFATPANNPESNGFCTISEAAIGNFSPWAT